MKRYLTMVAVVGAFSSLAMSRDAGAQTIRSFTTPAPNRDQRSDVPREYQPPRGMCRIWIDSVPPKQQPAPTDCATAVRNKPRNGRVIFGEAASEESRRDKGDKGKPKKPEG